MPSKKKPSQVTLGMHYATVAALLIANMSVLALAMLFANNVLGGGLAYFAKLEALPGRAATRPALNQGAPAPTSRFGRYQSAITVGSPVKNELPVTIRLKNTGTTVISSFEIVLNFVPQDVAYQRATIVPTLAPRNADDVSAVWNVSSARLAPGATWQTIVYVVPLKEPQHLSTRFNTETRYVQTADGHTLQGQTREAWHFFDGAVSKTNPPIHNVTIVNEHLRTWREGSAIYHSFRVQVANKGNIGLNQLWFLYDYDPQLLEYVLPRTTYIAPEQKWSLAGALLKTAHAVSIDFPTNFPGPTSTGPASRCGLEEIPDVHPAGCDMAHGETLEPKHVWFAELTFRQRAGSQSYESGLLRRILPWLFGVQKTNAQVSIDFPDLLSAETTVTVWNAVDVNRWGVNQDLSDSVEFRLGS